MSTALDERGNFKHPEKQEPEKSPARVSPLSALVETVRACNPSGSAWEIARFVDLAWVATGGVVLEIGVHQGGSARVWRDVLDPQLLVGVDQHAPSCADEIGLVAVEGWSGAEETLAAVLAALDGHPVDLLYIDCGHRYGEVVADWGLYAPLVRPGRFVAFHDVRAPQTKDVQVAKFWNEIRVGRQTMEIWDGTPEGTGVGVVFT